MAGTAAKERKKAGRPKTASSAGMKLAGTTDWPLLLAVFALLGFGIAVMYSASFQQKSVVTIFAKQMLFAAAGLFFMFGASVLSLRSVKHIAFLSAPVSIAMQAAVFVIGTSDEEGIKRFIDLKLFTIQPSEILKFAVILFGAWLFAKYPQRSMSKPATRGIFGHLNYLINFKILRREGKNADKPDIYPFTQTCESFLPFYMFAGLSLMMVLVGKHLSATIIIALITLCVLYFAEMRMRWFVIAGILGAAAVAILITPIIGDVQYRRGIEAKLDTAYAEALVREADEKDPPAAVTEELQQVDFYSSDYSVDYGSLSSVQASYLKSSLATQYKTYAQQRSIGPIKGYMFKRVYIWMDKGFDPATWRYQSNNSLYAIASGGLFGKGISNSGLKYDLPAANNDMIFAIICEELGLFGALIILGLFAFVVFRCMKIGSLADNIFEKITAKCVGMHLAIQVLLNIAVALDVIPNTGIPMPFFSQGGSSLVVQLFEIGVVLSIAHRVKLKGKLR